MRIGFNFHSADNYISGVENYSLGLLRSFLDIDKVNEYIVFTNKPDLVTSYVKSQDNLAVRDCSFLKNRLYRIGWEHLRLPFIVKKERLDILHCPHYISPALKTLAAYVITVHDTIAIDHPEWCKRTNSAYYGLFLGRSIKTASKIIAVSKFTAERIRQNFNLNGSMVEVIYPGIDTDVFNLNIDSQRQNQLRTTYNLPQDFILYSGNIEPKKNLLNLLNTFKLLRKNGCRHNLVITSQRSWKSKDVFDFLHKEFKSGEVILIGYIDRNDIGHVYKMANCLLLPSFCEGFAFPAVEAFACGVPIAASKTGILQEINPQAYTRLNPFNPIQMAESINKLLSDQKLRELQIKTGITAARKFNRHDCATRTLVLYSEVLKVHA